jgi:hypothetical protein
MSKQNQMILGLGIIVILLAGVVVIIMQGAGSRSSAAQQSTTTETAEQAATPSAGSMGTDGSAVGADGQEIPFDEASAVKIPADSTPRQWVEEYYKACDAGDWESAQKHLPTTKQQVTSAADLQKQLEGYGITGYRITGENEEENALSISADQETASYGSFTSVWEFIKNAEGSWLLKNKAVTAMGQ